MRLASRIARLASCSTPSASVALQERKVTPMLAVLCTGTPSIKYGLLSASTRRCATKAATSGLCTASSTTANSSTPSRPAVWSP